MQDKSTNISSPKFMTKEFLSKACCDCIEDILRKTFEDEAPLCQAPPPKCSQETQTSTPYFLPQIKKKKLMFLLPK